ncbi:MAG: transglycosylase SLT domain-containing protein [Acidobacteria bacterium]|nr:transglycosylase SLT domain-containing protein [Acidobacteriota bacterium]
MIPAAGQVSKGEEFYSYLDENGAQVFTNIPPGPGESVSHLTAKTQYGAQYSHTPTEKPKSDSNQFDSIIHKYANYYDLDPSLIHSIIATESGFNPNAVSSKGARGLMQLMPATAERLGVKNSFDPEQNIQAGVRHFRSLMNTFNNNLDLSLAAYNAGENLVRRLGRVPGYKETIHYVRSVTRRYRERRGNAQGQETLAASTTYRYVDAKGVLHLTNIPPTR